MSIFTPSLYWNGASLEVEGECPDILKEIVWRWASKPYVALFYGAYPLKGKEPSYLFVMAEVEVSPTPDDGKPTPRVREAVLARLKEMFPK